MTAFSTYVERIERLDPDIHAWTYFDREQALGQAEQLDEKFFSGTPMGRLAGIPIGVKDIFNTKDMPTQMGSPIWKGFQPGNDARVVHYLRMADAVIMGKTVTAEFAVHTPGPTRNPHDLSRSPGTSSSGSAAAVAAGMVPMALGTQTAGSIIRPASYCGVYGFKPSFGLIPRTGVLKTTDTLDTIGMFAQSVEDLETLFDVIRVRGRDFPTSERGLHRRSVQRMILKTRPWKIAYVTGPKWYDAEPYARGALSEFVFAMEDDLSNIAVTNVALPPLFELAHDVHAIIYDKTLAYYFREEFKQHTLVSPVMYDIIKRGNQVTLDQYKAALKCQRMIARAADKIFEDYDVIINLSTGGPAPLFGSFDRPDNCLIWTLCGLPTVSVPAFTGPNGLPFGLQVVGRRYSDYLVLQFCKTLARLLDSSPTHSSTIAANADGSNGDPSQVSRQARMGSSEEHTS